MKDLKLTKIEDLRNIDILNLDRRTFLKVVGAVGASIFLGTYKTEIVRGLMESSTSTNLVWLEGQDCAGCTISFLNAEQPDVIQAIMDLNVVPQYWETVMIQQGLFVDGVPVENADLNANYALELFKESEKDFVLVVEGAIPRGPDGTGNFCRVGGEPFKKIIEDLAPHSLATVAVGSCASYGGIPAGDPNPSDCSGLQFYRKEKGGILGENYRSKAGLPVINLPCCPTHPDWVMSTLAAVILGKTGDIDLDEYHRPTAFFGESIHETCPRRGYYETLKFGMEYCLYGLGCKGPFTSAECPLRLWNNGRNMCTQAGAPCVGCAEPDFPDGKSPFYLPSGATATSSVEKPTATPVTPTATPTGTPTATEEVTPGFGAAAAVGAGTLAAARYLKDRRE